MAMAPELASPFQPVVVDLDETRSDDGVTWNDDGSISVEDDPPPKPRGNPADHNANLAEHLSESDLATIGDDLVQAYEKDRHSRQEWERRLAKGIEIAGFVPAGPGKRRWMATVTYPLIAEAVVQFNARAIEELFPAAGPIKTIVVGKKTPEKEQQAERVQDYMNYQILEEDPTWQDEDDRLLMRLPLEGHCWKKVYRDERLGIQTSKFVSGYDVFAPYSATATGSTPRLCHRYPMTANGVKFEQLSGNWLDIELPDSPGLEDEDRGDAQEVVDEAEGSSPGESDTPMPKDPAQSRWILEFYVDFDLPTFEHVAEKTGDPTEFALPYIITVDLHSRRTLKIVRNWKEGDERYRKRINLIPFRFLPGLGFYGLGFLHVIGGLAEAATGALRALLDSAALNNLQGGWRSSDARKRGGDLSFEMGEWKDTELTSEELAKGFHSLQYHPPSDALSKLLDLMIEAGKSFTSTTEAMTGSAPSTGPVGTMVALIEQGSKVFSGIHKRLHKSKRDEYRLLAQLNAEHIPAEGYPYDPGNESRQIFVADFGPAVDVLPVSDPNIYSAQQRIAIAQAQLDLATQNPDLYDRREAHRRMLGALKVPDIDGVLLDDTNRPRQDPVSENMRMLTGQPAHAFPEQPHQAHIKVLDDFMQHPGYGGNPEMQQVLAPLALMHKAEHLAFLYQQQMMQVAGLPYLPVDLAGQPDSSEEQEIDPRVQDEIAVRAAMASEAFMQSQGLPEPPPDPAAVAAQAEQEMRQQELALKKETAQVDMARKGAELEMQQQGFMADQQQKAVAFTADMRRDEEAADQKLELDKERAAAQKKQLAARAKVAPKPAK